jgi:hypothetical protein
MLTLERSAYAGELLEEAERLLDERRIDAALDSYLSAESAGADPNRCSAGRWQAAMLRGDFEAAWKESDAIRQRGSGGDDCLWSGEEIDGKRVIVRCLHGFGDAVQMLRYAPQLAERAAHVTYETSPKLLPLVQCFPCVDHAITWTDPDPAWDVQIEMMELPYLFRTTLKNLPVADTYLPLPEHHLRTAAASLGPRLRPRVGVVWTCGDWNPSRNVPPADLRALTDLDIEFWSLQAHSSPDQCAAMNIRDGHAITDGLIPLAATIANLDLVITPDTLAAHLAGALGKPAFVMLQFAADWRWMTGRNETPWYPSLRLFRQPQPGDWSSVIREIKSALQALLS